MPRKILILHLTSNEDTSPNQIKKTLNDIKDDLNKNINVSYKKYLSVNALVNAVNDVDYISNKLILLIRYGSFTDYKEIFKQLILSFPECNIFFQDSLNNNDDWVKTLFKVESECQKVADTQREVDQRCILARKQIISEFHRIPSSFTGKEILTKILSHDNIYDISNLKACVKAYKFELLNIVDNFSKISKYRATHPAISIDEESSMSIHIAYCLHASGYRTLPISSFFEFKNAIPLFYSPNLLVLRDFDLQFSDAPKNKDVPYKYNTNLDKKDETQLDIYDVDLIRGFKRIKKPSSEGYSWIDLRSSNSSLTAVDENPIPHYCWDMEAENGKIYCISQGNDGLEIDCTTSSWIIKEDTLKAPGITKPLNGVFHSLRSSKIVADVIASTRLDPKTDEHNYKPQKQRIKNQHSLPLDLYNIARPLINRAIDYYNSKQFYLASVLAQDAIEIINCFHVGLTLEAYLLHAKSENAIAMNMLGCNEEKLAKDCEIRIEIIKYDIYRLVNNSTQNPKNVLNQIFSDCRQYCHEKEHFQSEEVFIDAMAKLNDGGPCPLFKKFKSLFVE